MAIVWKAPNNVVELLTATIEAHHLPRLAEARFAVAFTDTKPFIKNRFNWGKVTKFTDFNKLWHGQPYDFSIVLCSDVWHDLLGEEHRQALLDLHLVRCGPEYEPEMIIEGNKRKPVKDEWGRVKYTNVIKLDDEERPKWKVDPLDIDAFTCNVVHYGLWMRNFLQEDVIWIDPELAADQEET